MIILRDRLGTHKITGLSSQVEAGDPKRFEATCGLSYDDVAVGFGATEKEAIRNLKEELQYRVNRHKEAVREIRGLKFKVIKRVDSIGMQFN